MKSFPQLIQVFNRRLQIFLVLARVLFSDSEILEFVSLLRVLFVLLDDEAHDELQNLFPLFLKSNSKPHCLQKLGFLSYSDLNFMDFFVVDMIRLMLYD